jgi:hypothetical protein
MVMMTYLLFTRNGRRDDITATFILITMGICINVNIYPFNRNGSSDGIMDTHSWHLLSWRHQRTPGTHFFNHNSNKMNHP